MRCPAGAAGGPLAGSRALHVRTACIRGTISRLLLHASNSSVAWLPFWLQALALQQQVEGLEERCAQLESELLEAKQQALAAEASLSKATRWADGRGVLAMLPPRAGPMVTQAARWSHKLPRCQPLWARMCCSLHAGLR